MLPCSFLGVLIVPFHRSTIAIDDRALNGNRHIGIILPKLGNFFPNSSLSLPPLTGDNELGIGCKQLR